ncbi:MAG: M48 family metalloprotease [Proteobacteria bacterium]|nr:M48 family metalloprotease [Pseudomonadota bacterium]MBU1715325.1 M48 family metalloprotease [Pseudomonadota bacterium]
MIYSSLLYLLVVILILSTSSAAAVPHFPLLSVLIIFAGKAFLYWGLVLRTHRRDSIDSAARYFAVEQRFSILAISFLAVDVYWLDLKFFLAQLPIFHSFPFLSDLFGVVLFIGYLSILWLGSLDSYAKVFGVRHLKKTFVLTHLKINISIVLPWLILSFFYDLLRVLPFSSVHKFLESQWGEPLVVLVFFVLLAVGLPVLLVRLWGCTSMPVGPEREKVEAFCRSQDMEFADIMIWPLFEGKMLTAGVLGVVSKMRYLLITPALLKALTLEETEAVIAHEIGHVRRYHIQLYLLLFVGFMVLLQLSLQPVLFLLLSSDFFYEASFLSGKQPEEVLVFFSTLSLFVLMILYFRYVFGFFMRNFERQADLHAFQTMGRAEPLVLVLEKIGWLSGNIRDLPSWHHFGIGQRVDFLMKAQEDSSVVSRHQLKVYGSLLIYLLLIVGAAFAYLQIPSDILDGFPQEKIAASIIEQKIKEDPLNPLWQQFMGDLQSGRKLYGEAVAAYERNLALAPDNPEVLNNLAWLLLTAEEDDYLDPVRALQLAKAAVAVQARGYMLDTLAEAYWANGMIDEAIQAEEEAIGQDRAQRDYYLQQIDKFKTLIWEDTV